MNKWVNAAADTPTAGWRGRNSRLLAFLKVTQCNKISPACLLHLCRGSDNIVACSCEIVMKKHILCFSTFLDFAHIDGRFPFSELTWRVKRMFSSLFLEECLLILREFEIVTIWNIQITFLSCSCVHLSIGWQTVSERSVLITNYSLWNQIVARRNSTNVVHDGVNVLP